MLRLPAAQSDPNGALLARSCHCHFRLRRNPPVEARLEGLGVEAAVREHGASGGVESGERDPPAGAQLVPDRDGLDAALMADEPVAISEGDGGGGWGG